MMVMRWLACIVLAGCAGTAPGPSPIVPRPAYPLARATEHERRIYDLINLERTKLGLPAVVWSDELAIAARRGMASLDDPGTLPVAVANFARSETADSAHAAVMANPTLRGNLLFAGATHVGVGVMPEPASGGVLVTELFATAARAIDTVQVAKTLREALVDEGSEHHPDLDAVAQLFANGLAEGRTREQLWDHVRARIMDIDRRYVKIRYSISTASEPSSIAPRAVIGSAHADAIGVGVAQGVRTGIGGGLLWVVVMVGQKLNPFRN